MNYLFWIFISTNFADSIPRDDIFTIFCLHIETNCHFLSFNKIVMSVTYITLNKLSLFDVHLFLSIYETIPRLLLLYWLLVF
jgi:hypothetical protein